MLGLKLNHVSKRGHSSLMIKPHWHYSESISVIAYPWPSFGFHVYKRNQQLGRIMQAETTEFEHNLFIRLKTYKLKFKSNKWCRLMFPKSVSSNFIGRQCLFSLLLSNQNMKTSPNENIFRVTGPLCGEFTSYRWIPLTKSSDAGLWCFLWSAPE